MLPSRGSSQPRDQTHISCISCIQVDSLPLSYQGRPIMQHRNQQFHTSQTMDHTICISCSSLEMIVHITNLLSKYYLFISNNDFLTMIFTVS